MDLFERLRSLREQKKLSQGELERLSGLRRCYISRVENGCTTPSVETLERWARALGVPIYALFYETDGLTTVQSLTTARGSRAARWGSSGREAHLLAKFCELFSRMDDRHRRLLLSMAEKMANRSTRST